MLRFMRNKLVTVERQGEDTLRIRGVLDDDIYGVELDLTVDLSRMEILTIEGKWNRWTTPECPRAVPGLKGARGLRILDKDFHQKVQKEIGRKACRHFANLLLECGHGAREAVRMIGADRNTVPKVTVSRVESAGGSSGNDAGAVPKPVVAEGVSRDGSVGNEPGPRKAVIIDLHVHTHPASPCSSARVDDLIEEARRIGLGGICLTDHNHRWSRGEIDALSRKHGFPLFRGNEITTDQGDVLVFGLNEDIRGIIGLEALREKVARAGGFMILAHPFRGFLVFNVGQLGLTPATAAERSCFQYVDAIEVLNGKVTAKENAFASEVAAHLGLPATGGSDAHEVSEVGVCATRFEDPVRNEADLIDALRRGTCRPVAYRKERGIIGKET